MSPVAKDFRATVQLAVHTWPVCYFILWHFVLRILERGPEASEPCVQDQKQLGPQPHFEAGTARSLISVDGTPNTEIRTAYTSGPRQNTYVPIPGPWRRKEKPNWPDTAFQVPAEVPDGTIHYVTKGRWIGQGSTAHVELLPSGDIVKYAKSNPYCRKDEEVNRERVQTEAQVYRRLNNACHVPKLIHWDADSCCLALEYMENGSLDNYVQKFAERATGDSVANHVALQVRRR